jgi:RNA-directed DNA polymerase
MNTNQTFLYRAATSIGLPISSLSRIALTAPHRYKVFFIPKRSGRGLRRIGQPAKEVKLIQRWLLENELTFLPIHAAATAYVAGSSIRENARRHLHNRFLLKADFSNFFPSIKRHDVTRHLVRHAPDRYTDGELELIGRILCWYPDKLGSLELCVGAPSSPFISNSIMFEFDSAVSQYCCANEITYTRYADDLAFSTNKLNCLTEVPNVLRSHLGRMDSPRLVLNEAKTVFTSKKFNRSVTGVVLASQGYLSLGRDRKRKISAMIHRYTMKRLSEDEIAELRGLVAFARDVEPAFVGRLASKYSQEVLTAIQRFQA